MTKYYRPKDAKESPMKQMTLSYFFNPRQIQKIHSTTSSKLDRCNTREKFRFLKKANLNHYDKFKKDPDGYLFIATNNFTHYEIISSQPRLGFSQLQYFDAGTRIGTAEIDDDGALTLIEIHKEFRRKGLGAKLVKFINSACEKFTVFSGTECNSRYTLTHEGAKLIEHCVEKGILEHEQLICTSSKSPLASYLGSYSGHVP